MEGSSWTQWSTLTSLKGRTMKHEVLPDRCNKIFSVPPMKSLALKQTRHL